MALAIQVLTKSKIGVECSLPKLYSVVYDHYHIALILYNSLIANLPSIKNVFSRVFQSQEMQERPVRGAMWICYDDRRARTRPSTSSSGG